ncbi:MAG TPA: M23 family metallopeptidase [Caulobacteraceae bacterium]|nr:M23 family metallopeptidase [Caulobacteraceae bacterium]
MARKDPQHLNRRAVVGLTAGGLAAAAAAHAFAASAETGFVWSGRPVQGGFVIGRTAPRATVAVDGEPVGRTSGSGLFVVGFDRDAPAVAEIGAGAAERRFVIAPGVFDVQRIDGLPEDQVTPTDPALLERIAREARLKAAAFASIEDSEDFRDGFSMPFRPTRTSSSFGGQRVLNGRPQTPHYGVDLAAPVGTPIQAPAPGLVVLAEPALHFEGGLTLIDHGQGLVAAFLHQSRQMVRAGDRVTRGQPIGLVGQTGRATGPHLCWRLKWRGRNLDPSLLVDVSAPLA